jgi:membrane-associated phospholipid phosphatase
VKTAPDRVFVRPPIYLLLALFGAVAFGICAAVLDGDSAASWEVSFFRALNDLPGLFAFPVWICMQFGNLLVVPIGSAIAAILREWRMAVALLLAGVAKYLGAKVIKGEFVRHRPGVLLDDVRFRMGSSNDGLGFVSGHATIAVAVAVIVHPYLRSTAAKVILWTLTALVLVGRVYSGSHFPLDVIGGGGVGLATGALANLIVGVPKGREVAPEAA